jgi:hypothetical protein
MQQHARLSLQGDKGDDPPILGDIKECAAACLFTGPSRAQSRIYRLAHSQTDHSKPLGSFSQAWQYQRKHILLLRTGTQAHLLHHLPGATRGWLICIGTRNEAVSVGGSGHCGLFNSHSTCHSIRHGNSVFLLLCRGLSSSNTPKNETAAMSVS